MEMGLVSREAYELLMEWQSLYLRMSRLEPAKWRLPKKSCKRGRTGSWKYCYGKLSPEARRILAMKLLEIAKHPEVEAILHEQLARLENRQLHRVID